MNTKKLGAILITAGLSGLLYFSAIYSITIQNIDPAFQKYYEHEATRSILEKHDVELGIKENIVNLGRMSNKQSGISISSLMIVTGLILYNKKENNGTSSK